MIRQRWSLDDDARLLEMLRQGRPYADIADEFGRTPVGIESRAHVLRRYGYRFPFRENASRCMVRPTGPKGMTDEQVAWAKANPKNPEARMILGMHREWSK